MVLLVFSSAASRRERKPTLGHTATPSVNIFKHTLLHTTSSSVGIHIQHTHF